MATGIVSIAAHLLGMEVPAKALFWLNMVFYVPLVILLSLRAFWFPASLAEDVTVRGTQLFTIVPGTCVLGNQFATIAGSPAIGHALWIAGTVLWLALIYIFFTGAIIMEGKKAPLGKGIDGGWLIFVVGTESVALLGTITAHPGQGHLLLFAFSMYLAGGMLYLFIMAIIFYRLLFLPISPEELRPAYWINKGAIAITSLTGATLIEDAPKWWFLGEILPFLKGLAFFFWAFATWWIPILVALNAWRHLYKRVPMDYDPAYWSMVFPLGMYTASTFMLGEAAGLPLLQDISGVFIYIALIAWVFTFIGLFRRVALRFFPGKSPT